VSVASDEMACQELVELVTAYLDGALSPADHDRFERHLAECPGCVEYLRQMRVTVRLTGSQPREEILPAHLRAELLAVFDRWKRDRL